MKRAGPSIAKTKQIPLVERRVRPLVRCTDYRWRELFEAADVISEGAVRHDAQGPTYYGSTSILLSDRSHGGIFDDGERAMIHQMLAIDPHGRIRAIRIACLEAQLRAKTEVDSIRAELSYCEEPRGIRITVDVAAAVIVEVSHRTLNTSSAERRKR